MTKVLLHIEGFVLLVATIYFYSQEGLGWGIFFLCLLAPDLSMLGYISNERIGSVIYNLFHSYVIPVCLIVISLVFQLDILLGLSLIWVAHIAMDRTVGYGLKYPTDFKDTHLQRL